MRTHPARRWGGRRIYETGVENDESWHERRLSLVLAELAAEIPELTPREAQFIISLLHDENDRARSESDDQDWIGEFLTNLGYALRHQQEDLGGKVRLFGLMKARHDAR
jgi:hypothetical protein